MKRRWWFLITRRWFDKSFSLIVSRDGKAAVNFEHSWGDGVAVMRFFNEVHKDSTSRVQVHPDAPVTASDGFDPSQHVHRLEFRLSDAIKATVDAARKRFHAATDQLAVDLFVYEGFSKSFCKQQKVSPDAIMQLGFQVRCKKFSIGLSQDKQVKRSDEVNSICLSRLNSRMSAPGHLPPI